MRGGRLDWRIINKTSINVFFKIKKILFKDKPRYFPYLKAKTQRVPNFRFFIGGTVSFTLGPWSSLLKPIPDKNDHCTLSGQTYSSQNVRLTPEKCPTNLRVNTL
jgi:hypothetical protein